MKEKTNTYVTIYTDILILVMIISCLRYVMQHDKAVLLLII